MAEEIKYQFSPLVPLRDIVLFPKMIAPLFVGRHKSVQAIKYAQESKKDLILVTQKNSDINDPKEEDLYKVGVKAKIVQSIKLPDGTLKVLVEAKERVKLVQVIYNKDHMQVMVENIAIADDTSMKSKALAKALIGKFEEYAKLNSKINHEALQVLENATETSHITDLVAANLQVDIAKKQEILEITDVKKRLETVIKDTQYEISLIETEHKIRDDVKTQMEKNQKEYFLNEQLKAINKELGHQEDVKSEVAEIEEKIKKLKLSKDARKKAESELKKLKMMNGMSAEAMITRNYLDTLLSLPWGKKSKLKNSIPRAETILNSDHYGLEKIKERILEYLAVQKRTKSLKGPILCFVGPPGVGKTSLARSIAEATGRKYARFSLGGVRDEAEIRGHRKTYLGSMPGKILNHIKKTETTNPVLLLDEIDKMGMDYRGDPAAALLEVLDPEQNDKFIDHYIEVEYDLSNVLFIATANSYNIPRPLLDRMEIIRVEGYIEDEKVQIAKKHLLPKQLKNHKLTKKELKINDAALLDIIRYYTKESGVRNLEREISKIARKSVIKIERDGVKSISVGAKNLEEFLGVRKFDFGRSEKDNIVGVTTGLAFTEVGGDILSIEALSLPGKGRVKATGKLGDVMQESAQAAYSYFRSNCTNLGLTPPQVMKKDVHIHVPAGATPKDGPSAGAAIFTSIVSCMTGIPVNKTVAMTGEITLRGRILPIGGLKEKLLAALRSGIKTVLIPEDNKRDLKEIPKNITEELKIIPVKHADEVLKRALTDTLTPVKWSESSEIEGFIEKNKENSVVTH
ncbi:MAG: endopeptidase La [Rickettsiales bacterium]